MVRTTTGLEDTTLKMLVEAWNCFNQLEVLHEDDKAEFRAHIHALQNMILMRPTYDYLLEQQHEDRKT